MNFDWLKRYTPRSLYARAALILLVPILTIQIVVTVVFIQRLYEDVTEQMTESMLPELALVVDTAVSASDADAARTSLADLSRALDLVVTLPAPEAGEDRRLWYDLSGRVVTSTLRGELGGVASVDLANSIRRVALVVETPHGPMAIDFSRRRVSASNPHQLLVLMALTSVLATIVAFLYLRNQLRPVKRLAEAAEAFGRGRSVPFRPSGATEMRSAGSAFLDMRTRIDRMIEQRTMMLSGVSHDLRTPLTRMKLSLSLQPETPESAAMQRDIGDMEHLISTFLDFARGGAMEKPFMVDPVPLVRGVGERWRSSGHDVEIVEAEDIPDVNASPVALSRAVENLLENAVQYGKRARLSMASGDRSFRLTVEDDGPGIPSDRREEALKPFARLDVARNQDRGPGVGLGLAIAHDIARRHGGTLRLGESEALGGLKVDIVLPM